MFQIYNLLKIGPTLEIGKPNSFVSIDLLRYLINIYKIL